MFFNYYGGQWANHHCAAQCAVHHEQCTTCKLQHKGSAATVQFSHVYKVEKDYQYQAKMFTGKAQDAKIILGFIVRSV